MALADFSRDKQTSKVNLELELTDRELAESIWKAIVYQRPCPEDLLEFHRENS